MNLPVRASFAILCLSTLIGVMASRPAQARYPTCDCIYCATVPNTICDACAPGAPPSSSCTVSCLWYLCVYSCGPGCESLAVAEPNLPSQNLELAFQSAELGVPLVATPAYRHQPDILRTCRDEAASEAAPWLHDRKP